MIPIIETKRLILREFNLNDYKEVYEFGSNTEVNKYTGDKVIESLNTAKEIIKNVWYKDYFKYGYGRWAVIYKPENRIIGFAGLKYLPEFNETDIGFRFLPKYWGMGLASEASNKIIEYGFEKLKLNRIIGIALAENIASCKVLEKIGLILYKTDEYNGNGIMYNWYKIEK
ncbi:GNAT family N-acetyltransferase [Thalassobellus sediminis]|uniref:GNAT family N-acetyltransferase n=1 Tax=Thalassobellus sediminis TaxID=3367753 RepID=UPI0037BA1A80